VLGYLEPRVHELRIRNTVIKVLCTLWCIFHVCECSECAWFMDCIAGWHKGEPKNHASKRQDLTTKGEFGCLQGSSNAVQLHQMLSQHWDPTCGGDNMNTNSVIICQFSPSILTNRRVYWFRSLLVLMNQLERTMLSFLGSSVLSNVSSHTSKWWFSMRSMVI
jgi:hypothetical protein